MTKTIIYILAFVVLAIIGYFLFSLWLADKADNTPRPSIQYIQRTDTVLKVEYKDRIKYRNNIIYKTVFRDVTPLVPEAQIIRDTVFQNSIQYRDMILTLEKNRKDIIAFGWNEHDSLLKKYIFPNVGSEFIAYADSGAIRIDSKRVTWKGIDAVIRGSFTVNPKFLRDASGPFIDERNYYAGLKTGITLFDKIGVDGGAYYDYNNASWKLETELSFNFK